MIRHDQMWPNIVKQVLDFTKHDMTCSKMVKHYQTFLEVVEDIEICQKYDTTALAIKCNLKLVT